MRSSVLALVAAFAAVASASILPVSRVVEEGDVFGIFRGANFVDCPFRIQHLEPVDIGDEPLETIPHSAIRHNRNAKCSEGEMTVFASAEDAIDAVSSQESKNFIQNFVNSGEPAIYAVEKEGRTCGKTSFGPGTVVILFTPDETLSLSNREAFKGGRRYMIIDDPQTPGTCQYSAPLRPSETPEPSEAPTPGSGGDTGTRDPNISPGEIPTETDDDTDGGRPGPGPGPIRRPRPRPRPGAGGEEDDDVVATVEPSESPDATTEDLDGEDEDDGSVCFPADAQVETEDGTLKKMSDVEIGDRVKVADGEYSDVYMFTHKDASTVHDFVSLSTASGHKISATRGHYLYINGRFSAAMSAKVGDILELGNGARTTIKRVSIEQKVGLFNPQTVHGDVIVNSIRASTFTRTVEPPTAQALLAPLRIMYDVLGLSASFLNNGADSVAALLPLGQVSL